MLSFHTANASIGNIPILRDLDFTIPASGTVALIGRNGAGKTTLLRSVMGFTNVTARFALMGRTSRA